MMPIRQLDEEDQAFLAETESSHRRSIFMKIGAGMVSAFAIVGIFIVLVTSRTQSSLDKADRVGAESTQLEQVVSQRAVPLCTEPYYKTLAGEISRDEGNCNKTQCCRVSGFQCFQQSATYAGCLMGCNPDQNGKSAITLGLTGKPLTKEHWDCTQPHNIVPLVEVATHPNTELYCFSVYTKNTGSTKPSFELDLLRKQYSMGVSIFSCPKHEVFSDVTVDIGSDLQTIKVDDVDGEFHLLKRKTQGTWVNTGMFKQVWKAIVASKMWEGADWIVKVDADAVFLPSRLTHMLQTQAVSWSGIYIENCIGVEYGYFGNLEIVSHTAFQKLTDSIDFCASKIDWAKQTATKWGPIGEDLFAQMCMDLRGVSKISNFQATTDGACPGVRVKYNIPETNKHWMPDCSAVATPAIHPFKKVADWVKCREDTLKFGGN